MRKRSIVGFLIRFLIATLVVPIAAPAVAGASPAGSQRYVPGQVIVKFRPGASPDAKFRLQSAFRAAVADERRDGATLLQLPPGTSVEAVVRDLEARPDVEYAEPNLVLRAHQYSDPDYDQQWYVQRFDGFLQMASQAGGSVTVAVVDTGVDLNHPDLQPRIVSPIPGWSDLVDFDDTPQDENGHGTHVAGIIAAAANNGTGIAGIANDQVAPNVRILPVRVLDKDGAGDSWTIAEGIRFAVDNGADIINLSLGGLGRSRFIEEAVQYALERDRLVVASAGNEARDAQSVVPAGIHGVLTVGAHDESENLAEFTNYGDSVEVYAPGVNIYSTLWDPNTRSSRWDFRDGTSMAAPVVSGLAAILMARGMSALETYAAIANSADPRTRILRPDLLQQVLDSRSVTFLYPNPETRIAGTVAVRVRAPGAANVELNLIPEGQTEPVKTVALRENGGEFTAKLEPDSKLSSGWYTLTAKANTGKEASIRVEILWAADSGLTIHVLDPGGDEGQNAWVQVYRLDGTERTVYAEGWTDAEGDFRVQAAALPDTGPYEVVVLGDETLVTGEQVTYLYRRRFDTTTAGARGLVTIDKSMAKRITVRADLLKNTELNANLWFRDGEAWFSVPGFVFEANQDGAGVLYADPGEYGLYLKETNVDTARVSGREFTVTGDAEVQLPNPSVTVEPDSVFTKLWVLPAYAAVADPWDLENAYDYYSKLQVPPGTFKFVSQQAVSTATLDYYVTPSISLISSVELSFGPRNSLRLDLPTVTVAPGGFETVSFRLVDPNGNQLVWPEPEITSNSPWIIGGIGTLKIHVPPGARTGTQTLQVSATLGDVALTGTLAVNVTGDQPQSVTITLKNPFGPDVTSVDVDLLEPADGNRLVPVLSDWNNGNSVTIPLPDPDAQYWAYVRGTVSDAVYGNYELHEVVSIPSDANKVEVQPQPQDLVGLTLKASGSVVDAVYASLWGDVLADAEPDGLGYRFTFRTELEDSVTDAVYIPPGRYHFYTQAVDTDESAVFVWSRTHNVGANSDLVLNLTPNLTPSGPAATSEIIAEGDGVDVWGLAVAPVGVADSRGFNVARAFVVPGSYHVSARSGEHQTEGWWQYYTDLGEIDIQANDPVRLVIGAPDRLSLNTSVSGAEATAHVTLTDSKNHEIYLVLATSDETRAEQFRVQNLGGRIRADWFDDDSKPVMARLRVRTAGGSVVRDLTAPLGGTTLGTFGPGTYTVTATMGPLPTRTLEATAIFSIAGGGSSRGGGGGGGGGGAAAPAPTSPEVEEQETSVGSSGGSVSAFDGEVTLEIPANAVADGVRLTIRRMDVPSAQSGLTPASPVFEFTLTDAAGNEIEPAAGRTVRVKIRYSTSVAADEARYLAVYRENPAGSGNWEYVGGRVDPETGTVQVDLTGFSRYAVFAYRPVFQDMAGHWAKADVDLLASRRIVQGFGGLFRPDAPVTRAEFAKLLVTALRHDVTRSELRAAPPARPSFADVTPGAWYYEYVEAAARAGLVTGNDGRFRPDDTITREELTTMLVRALGLADEAQSLPSDQVQSRTGVFGDAAKVAQWALPYVATAAYHGVVQGVGDGRFGAGEPASRAAAAVLVRRLADRLGLLEVPVEKTGTLEISTVEGEHFEVVVGDTRYVLLVDSANKALVEQLQSLVGQTVTVTGLRHTGSTTYQRGPALRLTAVRKA